MNKLLALSLASAVACGGGSLKDQARSALPTRDTLAMGSPKASTSASSSAGDTNVQNSTAGDPSPFFSVTVTVAAVFNGPTAAMLDLLAAITAQEPSSCAKAACTWGPGSAALDYNNYQLVVTEQGASFSWQLSGQAKSRPGSAFVTFASGDATPGPSAHHGSGNFVIDFDQLATLDGNPGQGATGQLDVSSYSNVGAPQLAVSFLGAKDATVGSQRNNIVYSYSTDATTGNGDLDFAQHNVTTGDSFSVHSRWKSDGEGRADVSGLGSGYQVTLSECWGKAPFDVVFFSSNIKAAIPLFGGPDSGTEASCAFVPAAFSTKTAP